MNPGDVLLYKCPGSLELSNIFAHGIKLIEGNEIIHVALLIGFTFDHYVILEALENGVRIKWVKDVINRDNGLVLDRIATIPNFQFDSKKLYAIASEFDGKPYGYLTDLNILLQHGKSRLFPNKEWTVWFKSKNGHMCSETTQLVYEALGMHFQKLAALTEPDDYLSTPWITNKNFA